MKMKTVFLCSWIWLVAALPAPGYPLETVSLKAESAVKQTVFAELYTSEGCNSCPPADRWFNNLKHHDRLWVDLVPVVFHVDYWDYLGWKDRFAKPAFTQRQYAYRRHGYIDSVYTPGVIVNGRAWLGWRRGRLLPEAGMDVGVLGLNFADGQVEVTFSGVGALRQKPLQAHAVLLDFGLESRVTGGENRGEHFRHDFVAGTLLHSAAGVRRWRLGPLPGRRGQALVVWLTRPGDPRVIQALGGWLK